MAFGPQRLKSAHVVVPLTAILGAAVFWRAANSEPAANNPVSRTPDAALAELRTGNARFVQSKRSVSTTTSTDAERRHELAKGQHPFVAILCCADSRVCPEFIFDQSTGTIFEIRNAGNVADEDVEASFEYAVEHLHVPLLLVLAHKGCGAIEPVCKAGDQPLHDHLKDLQRHMAGIRQLILDNRGEPTPKLLDRLSKENARRQALSLVRESPVLNTAVEKKQSRLVCGLYDMETGAVEFFDPE